MRKILTTIILLGSTLMLCAAKADKKVTITIGNESREYWLYVPNNAKSNAPLVISLHGASGHDTDKSPFRTDVADKAGCIVAYPQGKEIYFPVFGGTVTGWDASGEDNEDVVFLKAVIEDVASKYTIDRNRIYCCGFSNGGMMTYANTNTCSDIFAAYAAISGFPLNEFHFRHAGWRPVPFLHIHGKNDDFVRYALMPTIVDEMVDRIGANPVPEVTTKSGKYTKSVFEAADGSFPYVYYEIDGMGHNDFTDKTETGSSAQTMWNFFKQYTLETPCDTTLKWRPCIETEGYEPKNHGWTVNNGTTLLKFGGDQKTDANQNVYRSLQFKAGSYKLCFQSEGDASLTIKVKIQKLTGKKTTVLNAKVQAGSAASLPFEITDGWDEYKITLTRSSRNDEIAISNISIYSLTEEEITGIRSQTGNRKSSNGKCFDLQGRQVENPQHGLYIKNGKKIIAK